MFWPIFPPVGRYLCEAIAHDYLLQTGQTWKRANSVFKEQLKARNIGFIRRGILVSSVGIWGFVKTKILRNAR